MFLYTFVAIELFCLIHGHLLPEDSDTDNAEQLNREKREDFFNNIFKTIPFFNIAPSRSSLKDEDDPNDSDDDDQMSSSVFTTQLSSTPFMYPSATSNILSAKVGPTATPISHPNKTSSNVRVSKTPLLLHSSSVVSFTPIIPSIYNTPSLFTLEPTFTVLSSAKSEMIKPTSTLRRSSIQTSYTTSASSRVSIMPISSANISPSSVLVKATPVNMELEPVIKMMIMSADDPFRNGIGPKLPDETGFGDSLAVPAANGEETEIKNIRYLYANVLIPVMSGIFGALLITLGIILYKCMRRRKLKKVRYYGGKPDTGLYRLDQMSLLSELTSDEDDD